MPLETREQLKNYLITNRVIKGDCWTHPFKIRRGYSQLKYKNKTYNVSRLSAFLYLDFNLEDSREICHKNNICKYKSCWNPNHLYIGYHVDNMQDMIEMGKGAAGINKNKTHCNKGHEFNLKNTYIRPNGNRTCRECNKLIARDKRKSNKEL